MQQKGKGTSFLKRLLTLMLVACLLVSGMPSMAKASDGDTVTVHYYNTDEWSAVNGYVWESTGSNNTWPGVALTENADHENWYDLVVTDTDGAFNCIFNNGAGGQTSDIAVDHSDGTKEVWYINGSLVKEAPEAWTNNTAPESYEVMVHYFNVDNWSSVYGYVWESTGSNNTWPGVELSENVDHEGWYDLIVKDTDGAFKCIFNNNSGTQTADLSVSHSAEKKEFWYVNDAMVSVAPEGWNADEEDGTVTVHYYNTDVWSAVNGYVWESTGSNNTWPGVALTENADHENWYDLVVTDTDGAFNCIFNNGAGGQTSDIAVDHSDGTKEVWYINGSLVKEAPEAWTNPVVPLVTEVLIHYSNATEWASVYGYAWNGSDGFQWPGIVLSENALNKGWFDLMVRDTDGSFGCIFNSGDGGDQTADIMVDYSDGTTEFWYTDGQLLKVSPDGWASGTTVTIHFLKPQSWGSNINAYLWTTGGALAGYSDYNTWPGKAIHANADHSGWYDLVVATEQPAAFNFIFNDGGNQTADLTTGEVVGDTELWVIGNEVMTDAPGEWTGDYDYTANLYFRKPVDWADAIHVYAWDGSGNPIMGAWPGTVVEADSINKGWYKVSITMEENTGFQFIFNDNNDKQTADLATGTLDVTTDIWVVDGVVEKTKPGHWVDPNRKIYVPGTFPGPSWDAGSNQMTYDPGLGLYVYTFEDVPAANYEFKIAVNGSWSENYGAGGAKDGSNIAVTVPETMDVIVYYNDQTHYAVTNVNYVFAEIALSGTGIPEGIKLSDAGLTGIYSVKVDMAPGTYTDVKLTYNGKEYFFTEFTLDEGKAVTFYMDPVTEIYYCDASATPIAADAIYYNSQDTRYKSAFGAVEEGEKVIFSIDTGADITSAVLVIKGVDSFPMTAVETENKKRWSCEAGIDAMGEYDYYFSVSNGSAVAIYGDDDGYYGEGKVTDLVNVLPYDLVVYQAGFETPDWMKDAVIYQIFPDRFFNGDPSNDEAQKWARGDVDYEFIKDWYTLPENPEQEGMLDKDTYLSTGAHYGDGEWSNEIYGGDLKGITQRIDYLKALGVNVIYLNPVFWSISNHRYDACDYTEIDPILGTLGDFEELVRVAEENDMHIILDGVFNHVSDDSVYFDRYYKFLGTSEKIGAYPYWAYVYDHMAEYNASQYEAEAAAKAYFAENYGITDWSYTEWFAISSEPMAATDEIGLRAGKPVYSYEGWWGYDSMPVIYSTNGSEYQTGNWAEEIICNEHNDSVTQYWITKGNDGWRLDVANEVSDETWQEFRKSVKALNDGNVVIIGEIWDDATKYLMGDMYDSVMNYMFRNAVTGYAMGTDAQTTVKEMEKLRERYPEEAFYAMMNLVGSHDTTRILSYLDGIGDDRADKSPEAAFPTYESTSDLAKNRQYLVSFLQFTYAGAPTIYYGDEIGMVGSDDPDDRRTFEWGRGNEELVKWYAELAAIRAQYPALRTGTVEAFVPVENGAVSEAVMGYVRREAQTTRSAGEALIVLANNTESDREITLDLAGLNVTAAALTDLLSGVKYAVDGTTVTMTVPAYRGLILTENVKSVIIHEEDLKPAYDAAYEIGAKAFVVTLQYLNGKETMDLGKILAGETVTIDAGAYEGYTFVHWMSSHADVTFADDNSTKTTFTMPEGDVTVMAIWKKNAASESDPSQPEVKPTQPEEKPTQPEEKPAQPTRPGQTGGTPTGDTAPIMLYGIMGLAAVAVIVTAERRRKRV